MWYMSDLLLLLDFFYPLNKQIQKTQLKNKLKYMETLKKNAEQRNPQTNKQTYFRDIRRRNT